MQIADVHKPQKQKIAFQMYAQYGIIQYNKKKIKKEEQTVEKANKKTETRTGNWTWKTRMDHKFYLFSCTNSHLFFLLLVLLCKHVRTCTNGFLIIFPQSCKVFFVGFFFLMFPCAHLERGWWQEEDEDGEDESWNIRSSEKDS